MDGRLTCKKCGCDKFFVLPVYRLYENYTQELGGAYFCASCWTLFNPPYGKSLVE
jgi:hypothetical protein